MKTFFTKIITCLVTFTTPAIGISYAQSVHRDFKFKKGEEFQRQIVVKSNCVMQRGGQKLSISSYSAVTKNYKVNDAVNGKATISITINKIVDSISALGRKVVFDSEKRPDPNSDTQMGLLQMIGKQDVVLVDYRGSVLSLQKSHMNDTLLSFTGIQPESLIAGNTLEFILDFPVNSFLKKGYTWTNQSSTSGLFTTDYTIGDVTGRTTTISYKSTMLKAAMNTRINGVLLVDNDTGVILKRATQSVTTGYEEVKGVIYSVIRRSATSEVCYKKSN